MTKIIIRTTYYTGFPVSEKEYPWTQQGAHKGYSAYREQQAHAKLCHGNRGAVVQLMIVDDGYEYTFPSYVFKSDVIDAVKKGRTAEFFYRMEQ